MQGTLNQLNEIAKKEGFGIEVEAQEIFKKNFYNAKQNMPDDAGSLIDVFAWPSSKDQASIFLAECKGASAENILLLFGNTEETIQCDVKMHQGVRFRSMPRLKYDPNESLGTYVPDLTLQNGVFLSDAEDDHDQWRAAMRHAYTGDFRTRNKTGIAYKKLPRNDAKNNLYKGICQLLNHLAKADELLSTTWSSHPFHIAPLTIIPMIITNAKIFIKENNCDEVIEVKWAIHSTAGFITAQNELTGYVFIVSVDELDKFIRSFGGA